MKYVVVFAMVFLYTMACALFVSLVLAIGVGAWVSCMKQGSPEQSVSEAL